MRAGTGPRSVIGLRGELTGSRGRPALPGMQPGFAPGRPWAPNWFPRSARPLIRPDGLGVVWRGSICPHPADARAGTCPRPEVSYHHSTPRADAWHFDAVKTYVATPATRERNWLLVDAAGQTLGRLSTQIADALRGKTKPEYTPHVDTGDFVVVINAEKIAVTGNKRAAKKYYRHSGYPGGIKERTLNDMLERRPEEVIRHAVKGMLPRNRLARRQITKLKVYAGPDHPHAAQKPTPMEIQS